MQLVAVDTPCILLVSYSSAVFCFSYGYGSLYNPSPLLRVPDRCNTFSDKIFHIPTYPRTLPSGRCRYILTPVYLQGFCRFYFQAWNITIIIFIKIIKANQTACLKIIKSCSINNDNNINNNIVYTLIFESYHSIFLLSSSYGFSQILSGLAIRRALLYAISKVKQVCPKYWIPASFLLTTNAKSGIFSFIRHIGIKSCIFLYNTVERLFYNLHLSFVWPF